MIPKDMMKSLMSSNYHAKSLDLFVYVLGNQWTGYVLDFVINGSIGNACCQGLNCGDKYK